MDYEEKLNPREMRREVFLPPGTAADPLIFEGPGKITGSYIRLIHDYKIKFIYRDGEFVELEAVNHDGGGLDVYFKLKNKRIPILAINEENYSDGYVCDYGLWVQDEHDGNNRYYSLNPDGSVFRELNELEFLSGQPMLIVNGMSNEKLWDEISRHGFDVDEDRRDEIIERNADWFSERK